MLLLRFPVVIAVEFSAAVDGRGVARADHIELRTAVV